MSTYSALFNLHEGMKAQAAIESRRTSSVGTSSVSSSTKQSKKSSLKNMLNALTPTEEVQTPAGIYRPIIKQGPLFDSFKPSKEAQGPTPIYQRERPLFGSFSKNTKKIVSEYPLHHQLR